MPQSPDTFLGVATILRRDDLLLNGATCARLAANRDGIELWDMLISSDDIDVVLNRNVGFPTAGDVNGNADCAVGFVIYEAPVDAVPGFIGSPSYVYPDGLLSPVEKGPADGTRTEDTDGIELPVIKESRRVLPREDKSRLPLIFVRNDGLSGMAVGSGAFVVMRGR